MKYKNIYVLLLIVAGSSLYAAEQPIQQEQMPRELIVEIFVRNLAKYTNQEALDVLKALRETNKSFATDKGLQQAIDYMKNYNRLRPNYLNKEILKSELTIIATLLRAQEWLKNNTRSVDALVLNIMLQRFVSELPLTNMLETVWPFSSQKYVYSPYETLIEGLTLQRATSVQIACEIAKFLHKKNIPINNQKTGYCEALQELIEKIQVENFHIVLRRVTYPEDQKRIENYKILYECLKDLGARLDPKYQEEAKKAGLE